MFEAAIGAEVIEAGKDSPAYCAELYRPAANTTVSPKKPIDLSAGPQLFIDDYLIDKTENVSRRVNSPARDPKLNNPIINGKDDLNFQPYMSVIRDPKSGGYRIWYGARREDRSEVASHIATMESDDGIHWQRPPRVLEDPAPIQFGCSVIDEGTDFSDPSSRFKFAWYSAPSDGLRVATSADGLTWKPMTPSIVLKHTHDITNIFWDSLRNRYVATVSVFVKGPTWSGGRRATMQSSSTDLINWKNPWYIITPHDDSDPKETQFYAMNGHLIRGGLWIGLVKVLHDNEQAKDTPKGSFGVGHTQLAWTRDGQTWYRDQTPYFSPDPTPGAWDHAHAWMDYQLVVGDETYIYYAGYKNGHKVNRFEERQIGLVRIPRDRYISRDADTKGGSLVTVPVVLQGNRLTANACVRGEMRVRLLNADGKAIAGFDADDCKPIQGDEVELAVEWKRPLSDVNGKPVRLEFQMKDAQLYAFDIQE